MTWRQRQSELCKVVDCQAPYGPQLLFYSGLFIATLAFGYATLARVLGLAYLDQRVDLIERSIRRGQGDPEPGAALGRDAEGSLNE